MNIDHIYQGDTLDVLRTFPDECVDTIITSPPYWGLRDYQVDGQIGLESTLEEYHAHLLDVTAECMRVLKPTGVMFWNHGDSYYGGGGKATEQSFKRQSAIDTGAYPDYSPPSKLRGTMGKCLTMQNERLIIKMIDQQGWILRNRIIWHKTNGMPSSATDRFTNKYEPVYMLTKNQRYWFDLDAVRESYSKNTQERYQYNFKGHKVYAERNPFARADNEKIKENPMGKNPDDVWTIPTQPYPDAHFATFPEKLIKPMILAGCPENICKKCGVARVRITERITEPTRPGRITGTGKSGKDDDPNRQLHTRDPQRHIIKDIKTIGWSDCNCNAGWRSGIVLDPFMGSGTTALVALKNNRHFIGIELSSEYIELAMKRLDPYLHQKKLSDY